jgi:hypothetical protein
MGWGFVAFGALGGTATAIANVTSSEMSPAFNVLVIPWAVLFVWGGLRTSRISVQLEDDSIVVHNQTRSHGIALDNVTGLEIQRRLALWAFGTQVVGVVLTKDKRLPMEATMSVRSPHGRLFTQSIAKTRQQVAEIARVTGLSLIDRTTEASSR